MSTRRSGYKQSEDIDPVEQDQQEPTELLDEEEQDAVISGLEKEAQRMNFAYRILFSTASLILCTLFFYLAYVGEAFGEPMSNNYASLVHTLTGLGCLLCGLRAFAGSKQNSTSKDQSKDSIILNSSMDAATQVPWWRQNLGLIVTIILGVIQFMLWTAPIIANLQFSTFASKIPLLIFPAILPAFAIATEYALHVMLTTENEVISLQDLKYHYKKL